jgi:lysophospholipid acyltransferase (LPLAT)-like uncharacterized protein
MTAQPRLQKKSAPRPRPKQPAKAGRNTTPKPVAKREPHNSPRIKVLRAIRRVSRSAAMKGIFASLLANYLRLVNATSRLVFDPGDPYEIFADVAPAIITMWHGQHFMLPFIRRGDLDVRVLISRHYDGEINALVAKKFGIGTIRGSGARNPARMLEKGGMSGFMEMKSALEQNAWVAMTADISNLAARRAGLGVVYLARVSGRPILPVAYASSRRLEIESWDRATLNLPVSRAACVFGAPIRVPADADDALLEKKRLEVQEALNAATKRAYDLVDRNHG